MRVSREGGKEGGGRGGGGGREEGGREERKEGRHTLTTKVKRESGSSRSVVERTSSNRKQNRDIFGKELCVR